MKWGEKDKGKLDATCKDTGDYFRFCSCPLPCCTLQRNELDGHSGTWDVSVDRSRGTLQSSVPAGDSLHAAVLPSE